MAQGPQMPGGSTVSPETAPGKTQAEERAEDLLDIIASDLYGVASMLVGEGEESAEVVERAVASTDIDCGCNRAEARKNAYKALARAAFEVIERSRPGSLAAPEGIKADDVCIEEDELESAGISG